MNVAKKYEEKYQLLTDKKYLEKLADFVETANYLDNESNISERTGNLSSKEISSLSDLFYEVASYAYDIYMYPFHKEFDIYFIVRLNDKLYQIGRLEGQGAFTYITKPDDEPNETDIIDITDLSKVNYRAIEIENALKEIYDFISKKRANTNIPLKAILNMLKDM